MKEVIKYFYKSIKFKFDEWQVIQDLNEDLGRERGKNPGLPATVLEAVNFMKDHRAHIAAEKDENNGTTG